MKASFQLFIKPNHYIVSGGENEYIYYEVSKPEDKVDVRYIRENAKRICSVSLDDMNIYVDVDKNHSLNESLGKNFSVYQDIISLEDFYDGIVGSYQGGDIDGKGDEDGEEGEPGKKFPTVEKILSKERIGYKIKYNINEMMFYSPNEEDRLRRLYRFEEYLNKKLTKALLLCEVGGNVEVYIQD